jgi:hypothetical protein
MEATLKTPVSDREILITSCLAILKVLDPEPFRVYDRESGYFLDNSDRLITDQGENYIKDLMYCTAALLANKAR